MSDRTYENFFDKSDLDFVFDASQGRISHAQGFLKRNLDKFVNMACSLASRDYILKAAGGDLITEPAGCFSCIFVANRYPVIRAVARHHSAFKEIEMMIEKKPQESEMPLTALEEEFNKALVFFNTPEFAHDTEYNILMMAWISFLYPNDETTKKLQQKLLPELEELDVLLGPANYVLPVVLWFADYDGFRAAVQERFPIIKAEYDKEIAERDPVEMRPGFIERNMESLVQTGPFVADCANTLTNAEGEWERCFLNAFWLYRGKSVAEIVKRHEDFAPISTLVEKHTKFFSEQTPGEVIASFLSDEFNAMLPFFISSDFKTDPDLLTLLIPYISYNVNDRNYKNNPDDARHIIYKELNKNENLPPSAQFMLIVGMWFNDYNGYRARVKALIPQYLMLKSSR